jgi:hypothetical protein
MIEMSTPIWVRGTVVRYEIVNPHTVIEIDEKLGDGQIKRWTVEGPNPARVQRMGVDASFLEPGDTIEICGFRPKSYAVDLPYVHGHMLVMPDGRWNPWGPYGKLENCVRPADTAQSWLDFLNGDPFAYELWCYGESVPNRTDTTAVVAEVHRLLTVPCVKRQG